MSAALHNTANIAELRPVVQAIAERSSRSHYLRQLAGQPPATVALPLTRDVLEQHLAGRCRIGVYPVAPGSNAVRCAAFDVDGKASNSRPARPWSAIQEDVRSLTVEAVKFGLVVTWFRSRSGQGAHGWLFWDAPQDAASVRHALEGCAHRATGQPPKAGYVEVFPKQDAVPPGEYGNGIFLPFAMLGADCLPCTVAPDWRPAVSAAVPAMPASTSRARKPAADAEKRAPIWEVKAALDAIPNTSDDDWDQWNRVGMAIWMACDGHDYGLVLFIEWSAKNAVKHRDAACRERWRSYRRSPPKRIGFGTLDFLAEVAERKRTWGKWI